MFFDQHVHGGGLMARTLPGVIFALIVLSSACSSGTTASDRSGDQVNRSEAYSEALAPTDAEAFNGPPPTPTSTNPIETSENAVPAASPNSPQPSESDPSNENRGDESNTGIPLNVEDMTTSEEASDENSDTDAMSADREGEGENADEPQDREGGVSDESDLNESDANEPVESEGMAEPANEVPRFNDVAGPCCRGGTFEIVNEAVDLQIEVDACPDLVGCRVNGMPNDCFTSHGSLVLPVDDGFAEIQFHFECIVDEVSARLTSESSRVTMRRIALCPNEQSPLCQ